MNDKEIKLIEALDTLEKEIVWVKSAFHAVTNIPQQSSYYIDTYKDIYTKFFNFKKELFNILREEIEE